MTIKLKELKVFKKFIFIVSGIGAGHYTAHSLSWSRTKDVNANGIMYAKVWTPEDPRANKHLQQSTTVQVTILPNLSPN